MDKIGITFMHFGRDKCPHCGTIGNKVENDGIAFLECPTCSTQYTNEIILRHGEVDEEKIFENN